MKGVFGDSQTIFGEALLNSVLPSHTYGQVSGGLPEKIPDLTYRELKEFYNVHYSPDNAKFYSYGSLDLEDHLKEISHYLPKTKRSNSDSKGNLENLEFSLSG
jgi:Zn-dependent M16 (insulinase) family peptidase